MVGRIFNIQRFCIHDGPGIRTTVFFKDCPLSCIWCHNPESITPEPQICFVPERCIGCSACVQACEHGAHRIEQGRHIFDRGRCRVCGACVSKCVTGALESVGREATVEEVLATVLRDVPFYETSGGGMTLSGGEPLSQIDFAESLLKAAHDRGLHTVVDTCGHVPFESFARAVPHTDLFLYDIKDTDTEKHRVFTGVTNELIPENLKKLHDLDAEIVLRLPVVPGCNDREDYLHAVIAMLRELPRIKGVSMIPYHSLGAGKRQRLGMAEFEGISQTERPATETIGEWSGCFSKEGINVLD